MLSNGIIRTNNLLVNVPAMLSTSGNVTATHGGVTMFDILSQKRCTKCGETKPLSRFHFRNTYRGRKARYDSWCKDCHNVDSEIHHKKNEERRKETQRQSGRRNYTTEKRHAKHLKVKFGMTPDEYRAMYDSQGGKCAICGKEETVMNTAVINKAPKKLSVDHDHKSGQVRGLLCSNCNAAIGYLDDNISALEKAIEYLKRWMK
jgi:hypothetical protein